eukprot:CAMPEP_0113330174 /NCGR_PEP_ID=MMETSP0010_2-20120614/21435_1 /TAXON_ID=216773 ORGANISM="Corethron hystrix, Strain 308" /NCGR_SAMPLE_ID=MMETSP0010_2 /ASSEMBLY_ACC=CAM_ASM_000155 /LENGTH=307 /DNA_ID=CAMNT_0000192597 /DNA_START=266 /DNA_END=1189 /DNA_ORIENTATION=+ /assembly_acc=CAM_ASM_000155
MPDPSTSDAFAGRRLFRRGSSLRSSAVPSPPRDGTLLFPSAKLSTFYFRFLCVALLTLSLGVPGVVAELCACSPTTITFQLDFSLTCSDNNIDVGDGTGIKRVECETIPHPSLDYDKDVTDFKPTVIDKYTFFELAPDLQVLHPTIRSDVKLKNRDTYTFESVLADDRDVLPGGLQIVLEGHNKKKQPILQYFVLQYTNKCATAPFRPDDSLGWSTVKNMETRCDGTVEPTFSPTRSPERPSQPSPSKPVRPSQPSRPAPTSQRTPAPVRDTFSYKYSQSWEDDDDPPPSHFSYSYRRAEKDEDDAW